ncbi:hypothetical protein HPP92_014368 [Vanilla planifolia]|uniref:Bromodomain associated domain-containing protein n=1 Tax=Vanilla planifolia TaxID=51239 RepID=A0A835UUP5_VANPL|nr:hypothetical protein HPP92_014368 [Vanilla planifolia]
MYMFLPPKSPTEVFSHNPNPPLMASIEDPDSSKPYPSGICSIAVSQICLTAGYHGASPSALRALTDIAGRYIQTLASSAAAHAVCHGRTQSNLIDLILALESLACARGFPGAADVSRPIFHSWVLRELQAFVEAVDEIPFPRPIRHGCAVGERRRTASFAEAGRDPPLPHVPRWLPCFPEGWERGEERKGGNEEEIAVKSVEPALEQTMSSPTATMLMGWPVRKERVRFRLRNRESSGREKKNYII